MSIAPTSGWYHRLMHLLVTPSKRWGRGLIGNIRLNDGIWCGSYPTVLGLTIDRGFDPPPRKILGVLPVEIVHSGTFFILF